VVCWAGPIDLAQTWPGSVGSNPTRPPLSTSPPLSLTHTVTALPLFSLATTTPPRRRRSPPAAPGQPRHRRDGAFALLDERYHLPLVDLAAVVSRGRPDSETLAGPQWLVWSPPAPFRLRRADAALAPPCGPSFPTPSPPCCLPVAGLDGRRHRRNLGVGVLVVLSLSLWHPRPRRRQDGVADATPASTATTTPLSHCELSFFPSLHMPNCWCAPIL
jgi:hypothetical protein